MWGVWNLVHTIPVYKLALNQYGFKTNCVVTVDGWKRELPIGPDAVEKVLTKYGLEDGHYMVRESRNVDNAYTLSLCHGNRVLNYRIVRHGDGQLCLQDPNTETDSNTSADQIDEGEKFPSLHALLEKHKHKLVSSQKLGNS